jgi:hypothetical protein
MKMEEDQTNNPEQNKLSDEVADLLGLPPREGSEKDEEEVVEEDIEEEIEEESEEETEEESLEEEEVSEEEEIVAAIEGEESEEEDEEVDQEKETLRRQVTALENQLAEKQVDEPEGEEEEKPSTEEFVTSDEELDQAMSSRESLNELLNKVVEYSYQRARESLLKEVPRAASRVVSQEMQHQSMVNDFFEANQDLLTHRKYVAVTFNEVLSAEDNAGKDYGEILTLTGNLVRQRLGISLDGEPVQPGARTQPRRRRRTQAPATRSRRAPAAPSGIAAEIDEMARL